MQGKYSGAAKKTVFREQDRDKIMLKCGFEEITGAFRLSEI